MLPRAASSATLPHRLLLLRAAQVEQGAGYALWSNTIWTVSSVARHGWQSRSGSSCKGITGQSGRSEVWQSARQAPI